MHRIPQIRRIDNLPVAELMDAWSDFLEPAMRHLPEKRLREVGKLAVHGIIAGQSPLVTQIARGMVREDATILPMYPLTLLPRALTPPDRGMLSTDSGHGLNGQNHSRPADPFNPFPESVDRSSLQHTWNRWMT